MTQSSDSLKDSEWFTIISDLIIIVSHTRSRMLYMFPIQGVARGLIILTRGRVCTFEVCLFKNKETALQMKG